MDLIITAIFSIMFPFLVNTFSSSGYISLIFIFWGMLSLITFLPCEIIEGYFMVSSYGGWLMVITVLVLVYIFMFRKDLLIVGMFNLLAFNTMLFFFRSRTLVFYITFEFSLVPMVLIILTRGYQPERVRAVLWFVLYTIIGSLPLLFILVSIWYSNSSRVIWSYRRSLDYLVVFPLALAFLVKLPVFGFHLWLPKAHVQAPVTGRMFLAAVLLKMGGYGLFFVKPLVILGSWVPMAIIIFSVLGSALAMFFCMMLDDLKQVIAYRRIGHMGLVVGTVISDNEVGILRSLLIIVGHGFTSSLIFYLGNEAYMLRGSRRLALTKGLIMVRPAFSLVIGGVLILNMSFPPSINVFGEMTAIMSIVSAYPSSLVLVLMLVLLGGLFNMKLFLGVSHGSNSILWPNSGIRRAPLMVSVAHILPYLLLPYIMSSVWYIPYKKRIVYQRLTKSPL